MDRGTGCFLHRTPPSGRHHQDRGHCRLKRSSYFWAPPYVIQFADGGIAAGCHHDSCSENGWAELRDKYEPGWREKAEEYQPIEGIEDPDRLARLCLEGLWKHPDGWTLRQYHGDWYVWNGVVYREVPEGELNAALYERIKADFDAKSKEAQARKDEKREVARPVHGTLLANVRLALQSKVIVPSSLTAPCWIGERQDIQAGDLLVAPNGLFSLQALAEGRYEPLPLTPRLFSPVGLDYAIQADAPPPTTWLTFLSQLWPKDAKCIETLQEWFGYCLTQDTRQHKMLLIVGPPRSGKSTIARILAEIVGKHNVIGQQMSSFRGEFALQPLLGKTPGRTHHEC